LESLGYVAWQIWQGVKSVANQPLDRHKHVPRIMKGVEQLSARFGPLSRVSHIEAQYSDAAGPGSGSTREKIEQHVIVGAIQFFDRKLRQPECSLDLKAEVAQMTADAKNSDVLQGDSRAAALCRGKRDLPALELSAKASVGFAACFDGFRPTPSLRST